MKTETNEKQTIAAVREMGEFLGKMFAYNNSLKLFHWEVTGRGSYAEHIALDQALTDLAAVLDRMVETSYALYGDINVVIPETRVPANIIEHSEQFFKYVDYQRSLFEKSFTASILDDYQEAIQQLVYRLKRLS